jgi:NAD(P)-dependent dehydrogenase (short-subunit alcohol dehydrogenase family)
MDQPPVRTSLVTGANRGIGLSIAKDLATSGKVLVVGRTLATANAARQTVLESHPDADIEALSADFSSFAEVRSLAERVQERCGQLDALVHNAAVVTHRRTDSADGIELQFQVNHLAPFLLTALLQAPLERTQGRVVVVASEAHRRGHLDLADLGFERRRYTNNGAYSQSKLANVLFAYRLASRWEGRVSVNAVHPGVVSTRLLGGMFGPLFPLRFLFRSVEAGAAPVVRLAVDPALSDVTGSYFRRFDAVESSAATYDQDLQTRLWDASTSLVGESYAD